MTFVQKRRATEEEIVRACFVKVIPREQVAEAWVDQAGVVEIVLHGFINKITVNVGFAEEGTP